MDDNAGRLLQSLPTVMRRVAAEVRRHGAAEQLTMLQFNLLRAAIEGPRTASALARLLGSSAATVTQAVEALVEKGLLGRAADPADRRIQWLTITPQGRALTERVQDALRRYLDRVMARLTAGEAAGIAGAIELLAREMEAATSEEPSPAEADHR